MRAALAAYTGVPAEYLVAGNGSDELLSLLAQILLQPGDSILVCPPTFSMYAFYAKVKNCQVVNVPRRADFSLDMEGIIYAVQTESPKMILIDNPGNPTGLNLPIADIEKLLDLPTLIVLDEAYIEFADTLVRAFRYLLSTRRATCISCSCVCWRSLIGVSRTE